MTISGFVRYKIMRWALFSVWILLALTFCFTDVQGQEPPADPFWQYLAFQEAFEQARGDLVEMVYLTKIDSATTLSEHVQMHPEEIPVIEKVLSAMLVTEQSFDEERGAAFVTVSIPVEAFPYPYRSYFRTYGKYIATQASVVRDIIQPLICGPEDFGWADGALAATGEWVRPKEMSFEEAVQLGFRAARADAMRNLALKIENIKTHDKTVGQYVKDSDVLREKVQAYIQRNVIEQEDTYAFADIFLVSLLLPLMQLPEALGMTSEFPEPIVCPPTEPEKRLARREAQQDAYEKLIAAIYEVPLKKHGTIADYVFSKPGVEQQIEKVLHEADVVREVVLVDGTYQVEIQFETRNLPWSLRRSARKVLGDKFVVIGEGEPH